jgi:hypothetical protein
MRPTSEVALLLLKFAKTQGYDWLARAANKTVLDLLQQAADASGKPTPNGQPQPDGVPQVLLNVSYKIGGGVWGGGDPLPGRAIEVALSASRMEMLTPGISHEISPARCSLGG